MSMMVHLFDGNDGGAPPGPSSSGRFFGLGFRYSLGIVRHLPLQEWWWHDA